MRRFAACAAIESKFDSAGSAEARFLAEGVRPDVAGALAEGVDVDVAFAERVCRGVPAAGAEGSTDLPRRVTMGRGGARVGVGCDADTC